MINNFSQFCIVNNHGIQPYWAAMWFLLKLSIYSSSWISRLIKIAWNFIYLYSCAPTCTVFLMIFFYFSSCLEINMFQKLLIFSCHVFAVQRERPQDPTISWSRNYVPYPERPFGKPSRGPMQRYPNDCREGTFFQCHVYRWHVEPYCHHL